MPLSNPRSIFGVHSVAPYNRTTREYHGILRVLGSSSLSLSGELISLNGGSSKYPFAVEDGLITAELSLTFREYPDFVFELFLGKAVTSNAAEAGGAVSSALANVVGTSVLNATTGIASVGIATAADVKFAKYVVKAVTSTTVDVYAASDVDFARGTDLTYDDDLLAITASALTVPGTGGTVAIPSTGLEFTGGSGSISMTADDTAVFETRPINTGSIDVTIGASTDVFPEFGAVVLAKQRGNGQMMEVDLFRVKAVGLPLGFDENAFSEASVTAQAFQDTSRGGVFSVRHVSP
jgi:hypothetical protein